MRRRGMWACLPLALLLLPAGAGAKLCGDDVRGEDVPCACGDVVVSDLTLDSDPVAGTTCPADALIVRAAGARKGLTIDLRGRHLRGSGTGTGIWILHGGPGGARVVSTGGPAVIEGFRDGVRARGADSVALIEGLIVRGSRRDGLRLAGSGYTVRSTEAWGSGRDGFVLTGDGFHVAGTRAVDSRRFGYLIAGREAKLGRRGAGIAAEGSGDSGIFIRGVGHELNGCVVTGSGGHGVRLAGKNHTVSGCRADNNRGTGIYGTGRDWELSANQARANGEAGIVARGPGMVDGGGNRSDGNNGGSAGSSNGEGNRGTKRSRTAQCSVGGQPCLP